MFTPYYGIPKENMDDIFAHIRLDCRQYKSKSKMSKSEQEEMVLPRKPYLSQFRTKEPHTEIIEGKEYIYSLYSVNYDGMSFNKLRKTADFEKIDDTIVLKLDAPDLLVAKSLRKYALEDESYSGTETKFIKYV